MGAADIKQATKGIRLPSSAVLLVILTFLAYMPALRCGYIWDDDDHFTKNPAMLSVEGLKQIWSSLIVSRYYPLTLTSFWVQRRFWGLHPLPYHAVNIALHAFNAVLLWALLRRLAVPGAWLAAAMWALHPVNVESVAWITELKNTQSGLFFLLAVLCFLRFEAGTTRRRWYVLALLCGLAAIVSKPSTVVLPLVLLLCTWWERGRCTWADVRRIAPLFVLALGMSALTIAEQSGHIQRESTADWNLGTAEQLVVAGKAVWFYASKIVWPARLAFVYPRWKLDAGSFLSWLPLAGLATASVLLWVWRRQSWARAGLFGCGFFVISLLPVLGFVDVYYFRYSYVADHFQYLASIGLISLAASMATAIWRRVSQWGSDWGALAASIVLLILGVSTWRQARIYQDVETLWRDTLAKNPQCWMAHNNLGLAFSKLGQTQAAISQYEDALRIKPDLFEAHYNLGNALSSLGQTTEAIAQYQEALRIKPAYADARRDLGYGLLQLGKAQDAIGPLEQTLRVDPNDALAHARLAFALSQVGKLSDALHQYEQALRMKPDLAEAINNLAWLLATLTPAQGGDPVRAVGLARRACELTGNQSASYLDTLGAAYAAAGRFDDAVATAQKAINLACADGQPALVREMEARLQLYREGHVYHTNTL